MGNVNRKATDEEMAHAIRVIREAFPEYEPVFGSHGSYGGGIAPRDHTISFRLRDQRGKYHSNVIWILPAWLGQITVDHVRAWVKQGTSHRVKKKPKKKKR